MNKEAFLDGYLNKEANRWAYRASEILKKLPQDAQMALKKKMLGMMSPDIVPPVPIKGRIEHAIDNTNPVDYWESRMARFKDAQDIKFDKYVEKLRNLTEDAMRKRRFTPEAYERVATNAEIARNKAMEIPQRIAALKFLQLKANPSRSEHNRSGDIIRSIYTAKRNTWKNLAKADRLESVRPKGAGIDSHVPGYISPATLKNVALGKENPTVIFPRSTNPERVDLDTLPFNPDKVVWKGGPVFPGVNFNTEGVPIWYSGIPHVSSDYARVKYGREGCVLAGYNRDLVGNGPYSRHAAYDTRTDTENISAGFLDDVPRARLTDASYDSLPIYETVGHSALPSRYYLPDKDPDKFIPVPPKVIKGLEKFYDIKLLSDTDIPTNTPMPFKDYEKAVRESDDPIETTRKLLFNS